MNCLHCTAETSNGLALCDLCQRKASVILEVLPVYFGNLARWRPPARPNGSLGTAGTWLIKRGDSEGNQIGNALERSSNDLTTWARALSEQRDVELPTEADTEAATVETVCAWLAGHLTSIATLEWAGQFVRDVDRHERILRGLTEVSVPGWYAGACRRKIAMATAVDDGLCGAPTYVVPGLTWVTCGACGSTTYARDHLDSIIDEARDWLARPKALAEAVVALVDTEPSAPRVYTRIRQWAHQGDIEGVRRTERAHVYLAEEQRFAVIDQETGFARYRFGDVLDRILATETRAANDARVS